MHQLESREAQRDCYDAVHVFHESAQLMDFAASVRLEQRGTRRHLWRGGRELASRSRRSMPGPRGFAPMSRAQSAPSKIVRESMPMVT